MEKEIKRLQLYVKELEQLFSTNYKNDLVQLWLQINNQILFIFQNFPVDFFEFQLLLPNKGAKRFKVSNHRLY
jgi:hypothetical protein